MVFLLHPLSFAEEGTKDVLQSKEAVFRIFVQYTEGVGTGSGFLVSDEGHLVTNNHVVKNALHIWVYVNVGKDRWKAVECIPQETDKINDLAILKLQSISGLTLPKPLKVSVKPGEILEDVIAIGFPGYLDMELWPFLAENRREEITEPRLLELLEPNVTKGAISKTTTDFIYHDAKISEGNSGGPLVSMRSGEVLGVNTFGVGEKVTFFIAIVSEKIIKLLNNDEKAVPKFRQAFELRKESWDEKDYSHEERETLLKARAGDAEAQYKVSLWYDAGKPDSLFPVSAAESIKWLEKAAGQNHLEALKKLGDKYYEGKVLEKSIDKATALYLEAAELGDAHAQLVVGSCFLQGLGVTKSDDKAFIWIEKAAQAKDQEAQIHLAFMYEHGLGTSKSLTEAEKWYLSSCEGNNPMGHYKLGMFYLRSQDKNTKEKAFPNFLKSVENQYINAYFPLAICYETGCGIKKDPLKAFEYYKSGAEKGSTDCMYVVGCRYFEGRDCEKDGERAFYWINKAAEDKDLNALFVLGCFYQRGTGVKKSSVAALELFLIAAEHGNPNAQYSAAMLLAFPDDKKMDASFNKAELFARMVLDNKNADESLKDKAKELLDAIKKEGKNTIGKPPAKKAAPRKSSSKGNQGGWW